eukprot:TRINITY_DN21700_c0_g1_i1.p1 TRINITY_DN21700_c0_g1~~TRINITY_DN21700_c0_g1_i1.p1  ORF type:complete len:293 (+),score=47.46 TRINITY_DN21700_c0_g1_i1:29-880(+)
MDRVKDVPATAWVIGFAGVLAVGTAGYLIYFRDGGSSRKGKKRTTVLSDRSQDLEPFFIKRWAKPAGQINTTFTDLPRLTSRMTIVDSKGTIHKFSQTSATERLRTVVLLVADEVGETVHEDLEEELDDIVKEGDNGDLAATLRTLFTDLELLDSKLLKIFKTTQQQVVIPVSFTIKNLMLQNDFSIYTKDMHTKDAWRIIIDFSDENIVIKHIRREASSSFEAEQYFEVEWVLAFEFPTNLEQPVSVTAKIQELTFGEETSPEFKKALSAVLKDKVLKHIHM